MMGDRDDPLDIFAPPAAPAGGGRLVWGLVAGTVACAALAFAVAAWHLLPARGEAGARPSPAALPSPPVKAAPKIAGAPAGAVADPAPAGPADEQTGSSRTEALPASPPTALWGVQEAPPVWSDGRPPAALEPPAAMAEPAAALEPPAAMAEPAAAAAAEPPAAAPAPPAAPRAAAEKPAKPRRPPAVGAAPPPAASARCRAAVVAAQIGEVVSPADLARMRAGCAD